MLALAGCGGDEIVSPGTGGDIIINNPTPTPTSTPTPTPTSGTVTPAGGCPTISASGGLTDDGTITGDTGTYRVCVLPATIDADTNLPFIKGLLYAMDGRVDVGTDGGAVPSSADTDVTLSIEPGVVLFAGNATTPNGESYLVVNRGNQINAVGTADMPIIFTSRDNVLGIATEASIGQWGGVVLLGRAPVSDCRSGVFNDGSAAFDQASCEQELEGAALTTLFGGDDADDSSGTMQYFQIRYSGFTLTGGSELQSLTTGGIGGGTTIDHWQSFNSSDDGMEFFGGTVNMKYVVAVGADDDSIDVDTGAQADMQYVLVAQRTAGGDHIIELDSPDGDYDFDALPRTNLRISNATFIERSTANSRALRLRGGADFSLVNSVIDTDTEACLRIDEDPTINAAVGDGAPFFAAVVADCDQNDAFQGGSGVTAQQVADLFNNSSQTDSNFTIELVSGFINSDAINATGFYYNPTQLSSFFDDAGYIGAVKDASDDWYAGWTCDSAVLTFGDNTGACTTLPVY